MFARWFIPAALALIGVSAVTPALATSTVVPDEFPTIQAGIDSGRDTVFVKSGRYAEDLTIRCGVTLLAYPGWPGDAPQAGRFTMLDWRSGRDSCGLHWGTPIFVQGFRFRGKVERRGSWTSAVEFEACRMDSGMFSPLNAPIDGPWPLVVRGCTILGGVSVSGNVVQIMLCSILGGGVYVNSDGFHQILENYIQGPATFGIDGFSAGEPLIEGNTVVGTQTGIHAGFDSHTLANEVMDCSGSGYSGTGSFSGNLALRCGGYGFDLEQGGSYVSSSRNSAFGCAMGGIRINATYTGVDSNIVGHNGGPGIEVAGAEGSYVTHNTSFLNQGPGFVTHSVDAAVSQNIAYDNLGVGLSYLGTDTPSLTCNDWFGNTGGPTGGVLPGPTDLAVDPLFCDPSKNDVHLSGGSPLLDTLGCGFIGALGQGCLVPVGVSPPSGPLVRAFSASPNPSRGTVQFSWVGSARPERVDIYDVTGSRRWSAATEPGASALAWPGTDSAGRRLPAGVYYARLTSRGTSATTRFVLVR